MAPVFTPRQATDYIVLHCAATPSTLDIGVKEIRKWHVEERGWLAEGYHRVIRRNGKVEQGRPDGVIGAHVEGHNKNSIGVCLVGGTDARGREQNNFTPEQWAALKELVLYLRTIYPNAKIVGHRDFPGVTKFCPSFDAKAWAKENGFA